METFVFIFILGLTCLSLRNAEDTLNKLQVIFRHGYRYPITLGWTDDACAKTYDSDKLGNLTNLGKSQMTLLGYFLRLHYNNFIGPDTNKTQVYYSDCYRDLESAQLVYEALFDNFDNKAKQEPKILNKTIEGDMATDDDVYNSWLESIPWNDHLRDQCKSLNSMDGMSCNNRTEFQNFMDQMISEEAEDCAWPSWLKPEVKDNLQAEYNAVYESMTLCQSKNLILNNSDEMLKWMNEEFKEENSESHRAVQLYASHDTNIAIILTRMGVFNSLPVPFGAALAFEQHLIKGKRIIRVFYDNSTDYSNFHKLKLPGCDWDCPHEKFIEIVTGSHSCSFATRLQGLSLLTMAIMSTMLLYLLY